MNILHKKFKYATSQLLGQRGKKSINKIYFILLFAKAKFLSEKAVEAIIKLTYILKNNNQKCKTIAINKNKCLNCYKIENFRQNYKILDHKLLKKKALAMLDKIATTYLDLDPTINNNKKQMLLLSTPKK